MEHTELLGQSCSSDQATPYSFEGKAALQKSFEAAVEDQPREAWIEHLPTLPATLPAEDVGNELSPPSHFLAVTLIFTVMLGLLNVCTLCFTLPALCVSLAVRWFQLCAFYVYARECALYVHADAVYVIVPPTVYEGLIRCAWTRMVGYVRYRNPACINANFIYFILDTPSGPLYRFLYAPV